MKNAVAIIPARGGSKGIPGKNIMPVGGKPLLGWSVEAAQGCSNITRVIVSSDAENILEVAKSFGAEALKRPAEIAQDKTRSEPVVVHALEHVAQTGGLPEWMVYLQPTSPLRTAAHLKEAFELLQKNPQADALVSVCEGDRKVLKMYLTDKSGYLHGIHNDDYPNWNRQDLPPVYVPNGAMYILKAKNFLERPRFIGDRTLPFVMSAEDSLDLDTPEDIPPIEAAFARRG